VNTHRTKIGFIFVLISLSSFTASVGSTDGTVYPIESQIVQLNSNYGGDSSTLSNSYYSNGASNGWNSSYYTNGNTNTLNNSYYANPTNAYSGYGNYGSTYGNGNGNGNGWSQYNSGQLGTAQMQMGRPPGGNRRKPPPMSDSQKQAFESCVQAQGITLPTQGTNVQQPATDSQRQAIRTCAQQALATGQSSSASPISLSTSQQQAMLSCLQQQGVDVSNFSANTQTSSVVAAWQTCQSQLSGTSQYQNQNQFQYQYQFQEGQ